MITLPDHAAHADEYYLDRGLLAWDPAAAELGINYDRYHEVVGALRKMVLAIQHAGDKAAADRFIENGRRGVRISTRPWQKRSAPSRIPLHLVRTLRWGVGALLNLDSSSAFCFKRTCGGNSEQTARSFERRMQREPLNVEKLFNEFAAVGAAG